MLMFRKMTVDDLGIIYNDLELRSLLTVPLKGEKFGVVVDKNDDIVGGVTGYIDNENAVIQKILIKDRQNYNLYKDGLIRALIHILDLAEVKFLFVSSTEDIDIYTNIGFQKRDICLSKVGDSNLYIDIEAFFQGQGCDSCKKY